MQTTNMALPNVVTRAEWLDRAPGAARQGKGYLLPGRAGRRAPAGCRWSGSRRTTS